MTLKAVTDALALPLASLGDGWTAATGKILARIAEIVDEAERLARERDRLRDALRQISEHVNGRDALSTVTIQRIARAALAESEETT